MVQILERDVGTSLPSSAPTSVRSRLRTSAARLHRLRVPLILQLCAMVGIGALVYSSAADWFATLGHNAEISGYVQEVGALPDSEREAELDIARAYNAVMPQGVLRDPYGSASGTEETDRAYLAYAEVMNVSDNGVIGQLTYSRLGIGLPIYHGTSDAVISNGVGHLFGSSLPVGGPSTHSVLTSHSGLVHASLFTPLPKARLGDTFTVEALGETKYYEVDQVETVLPEQTEGLQIVDGEDFVTLITCTPIGINSHRLLIRGVRVDAPAGEPGSYALPGDGKTAGIPWWAFLFLGGSITSALLLFTPSRRRRHPHHSQGTQATKQEGT